MKRVIKSLTTDVLEIMNDLCTDWLTIECCDMVVQGCLLTHCYYVKEQNRLVFSSGDMFTDKHAEEILLTDDDTLRVLKSIIECYD
jgi:hypothetical protein